MTVKPYPLTHSPASYSSPPEPSQVLLHADPSLAADAAASGAGGGFPPLTWLTSGWNGVTSALSTPGAQELWLYTLKTVISWGVPAVTVAVAAFFVLGSNRRNRNAEGPKPGGGGPFAFLNGGKMSGANTPSPFVIKRLNDKLDSYAYAFQAATVSAESVENAQSRKAFADKYATVLGRLTSTERQAVTKAADRWAREEAMLRSRMATLARSMRAEAVAAASKNGGNKDQSASPADSFDVSSDEDSFPLLDEVEDEEERLAAAGPAATGDNISDDGNFEGFTLLSANATKNKLGKVAARRAEAEATYVRAVAAALPVHKRARLSKLLSDPRMSPGWEGGRDPLRVPEERMARRDKPHVYVLQFFGDVRASQAAALREEVTAVLRSAKPGRGDEVVLVLNTGGGTVTGYGLAAAQLTRLKAAGIRLTICVEQVAASGGYMMACTADRLVASPFAVLGSIGVISEVPNVYERLKKEGIEFQTVTAGKFKRTLTPTKRIEPKDLEKSQADIESILTLFKSFVGQQRPQLDIDNVATGETWFGEDALKQKLCDELKTTDDVLLELLKAGSEIFFSVSPASVGSLGAPQPWRWRRKLRGERGERRGGVGRAQGDGAGRRGVRLRRRRDRRWCRTRWRRRGRPWRACDGRVERGG